MKYIVFSLVSILFSSCVLAEQTGLGKIIYTEGHIAPNCRTVRFKESASGTIMHFRIADIPGDDDVGAVVLAALMANRDVTIFYSPSVTTGCGPEPRIEFVTVY